MDKVKVIHAKLILTKASSHNDSYNVSISPCSGCRFGYSFCQVRMYFFFRSCAPP